MSKVFTSAVVIVPPESISQQIQEIRKVHDKAFDRWLPHINLVYPFVNVSEFDKAEADFTKALSQFSPFTLTFNEISHFNHGSNNTFFLKPKTDNPTIISDIQKKLVECFPHCNDLNTISDKGFQAHLTLGQTQNSKLNQMLSKFQKEWRTISWKVDKIYIIARTGNTPFVIKKTIPIGGSAPIPKPAPITAPIVNPAPILAPKPVVAPIPAPISPPSTPTLEAPRIETELPQPTNPSSQGGWIKNQVTNGNNNANVESTSNSSNNVITELFVAEPGNIISSTSERLIYVKVKEWINYLGEQDQPLPKTREKFKNAIKKMCFVKCNLNTNEVIEALKETEVKVSGDKAYRQITDPKQPIQLTKKWQAAIEKEKWIEVEDIYKKAVNMVRKTAVISLPSLKTSLTQICRYKRFVSPDPIVEQLIQEQIISEFVETT